MRINELIKNIYEFDMFGLNLNELLGVKVYKNCTKLFSAKSCLLNCL